MKRIIRASIQRPVATLVGGIVLTLFGVLAIGQIPIQLTPTLEAPRISISTAWPGATPAEIEREIVIRQEEQLEDLENLLRLESQCTDGMGTITLTFPIGTDLELAMMRAANRLEQVRGVPLEAEQPTVDTTGSDNNNIAWFMLTPNEGSAVTDEMTRFGPLMQDVAQPRLERVAGVARVNVFGAQSLEMQIRIDSAKLAARGITLAEVEETVRLENRDWGAGDFSDGKRRWKVRALSAFHSPEELEAVVIGLRHGVPVRLGDVAEVELSHGELKEAGFYLDQPTIGVSVSKKPGTNVLEVMAGLRAAVDELNHEALADAGVRLEQSYDETEYIDRAIALVRQSLLLGGVLAVCMLMLFLRSGSTTLLVSIAIPLSLVGTFSILWWTGRSLNVISLAGLAFAVGMVVDNSIVVIENIYRHRQMGKSRRRSAMDGTCEVRGAVLASTLTTVAVFLPITFLEGEVGQLFRDLAVAISSSVLLSLLVAMTVIPSLSAKLLEMPAQSLERSPQGVPSRGRQIADWIGHVVYRLCGVVSGRLLVVVGLTALTVGSSWMLAPPMEYLPMGNRNFVYGVLIVPGEYNVQQTMALREPFVERLGPLWRARGAEAEALPGGGLRSFYYVGIPGGAIFGLRARDPDRAQELISEISAIDKLLPGAQAFAAQRSIFENGTSRGRNIDIALSGPEIPELLMLGRDVMQKAELALPDAQIRPSTQLEVGSPEIRVLPNRYRLAQLGITTRDVGLATGTSVDGAWVGRYIHEGRELDLKLIDRENSSGLGLSRIREIPVPTPSGDLIALGNVSEVVESQAPAEIQRLDRRRSVQIHVEPPPSIALEQAMARLDQEVVEPLRADGVLGGAYSARLSGSSDSLTEMAGSMGWIFLLAIVLTFLLMAALFESFLYPFIILWTVPLATFGGMLGLGFLNLFQPQRLDVLTMLGFVILVGTVVNNAILLVHQALNHLRNDDMNIRDAVTASARNRVRPIFMSVTTSVFGMMPLVIFPGAGSELYRGLGSVVLGGLLVSTVLTLLLIPCLLSLVLEWRQGFLTQIKAGVGYHSDDTSRFDLSRPLVDKGSGTFAAAEPSGTIDL